MDDTVSAARHTEGGAAAECGSEEERAGPAGGEGGPGEHRVIQPVDWSCLADSHHEPHIIRGVD